MTETSMPIKFRCQHCRQFLGISRGKAGAVVDCPTCGRTVRVPHLDGRVDPLPEPGMDPQDSRLSQALDELARIGESSADASEFELLDARRRSAAVVTREEVTPLPELPLPQPVPAAPVPAGPPPALTPVPVAGGLKIKPLPARPTAKTAAPPGGSDNAILSRARQSSPFSEELVELAASETDPAVPPDLGEARRAWRPALDLLRRAPRWAVLAIGCGTAVAGLAGFLVGQASAPAGAGSGGSPSAEPSFPDPALESRTAPAAAVSGLAGRISYAGDRQTLYPDEGARIIAVPVGAKPEQPLPAKILLDDAHEQEIARDLRDIQGGLAVAAADGTFELELPTAGVYRVLIVSGRQPRDPQTPLEPGVEAFARDWLDPPELVTDKRACRTREIRYSGEGRVPFDCFFESPVMH